MSTGDLPDSWIRCEIGEVARIVGGSTPKTKTAEYWDGEIPWLAVSDLTGYTNKHISKGARSITQAGYDSCATKLLPAGSVVFSSRAPIGYVAIAGAELCTSQGFKSFVFDDKLLSPDYLYWYLRHIRPIATSRASGTTFPELSGKAAAKLPLVLPPRGEQDRIVATIEGLLEQTDEGGNHLAAAHNLTGRLTRSTIAAAFRGDLVGLSQSAVQELSLPRHRLAALADIQYGWTAKAEADGTGPRMLRITDIQDGRVEWSDVPHCTIPDDKLDQYRLGSGDIVFARTGATTGKSFLLEGEFPESVFASYLIRVRCHKELDPRFLALFFQGADYWAHIQTRSRGVGQPNVNGSILGELEIPTPSLAVQQEVVETAEERTRPASQLESLIRDLELRRETLRWSILYQAFSGSLTGHQDQDEREPHPTDALEPA